MYSNEDIPKKELSSNLPSDIEIIIIELNINKIKWLVCGCYHSPSQSDEYFFYHLGKVLDNFSTKYDRFVLLKTVKNKTCFKSIENPSCIDLIITDKPGSFQYTNVFEAGRYIGSSQTCHNSYESKIYKGFAQVCSLPQLQKC